MQHVHVSFFLLTHTSAQVFVFPLTYFILPVRWAPGKFYHLPPDNIRSWAVTFSIYLMPVSFALGLLVQLKERGREFRLHSTLAFVSLSLLCQSVSLCRSLSLWSPWNCRVPPCHLHIRMETLEWSQQVGCFVINIESQWQHKAPAVLLPSPSLFSEFIFLLIFLSSTGYFFSSHLPLLLANQLYNRRREGKGDARW